MTPAMESTLYMNYAMRKVKNYLFWGFVNACLLSLVLYDIIYTCSFYSNTFHYVEWAVASLLGINTLFHFWRYFWTNLNLQPIVVTPIQKKLLGVNNSDSFFKVQDVVSPIILTPDNCPTTPVNFSPCSWLSSPTMTSLSDLDNISSSSWVCLPGSPRRPQSLIEQKPAPVSPASRYQNALNLVGVDSVTDEDSLCRYLKEYNRFEKSCAVGASMEQPSNLLSTFWSHSVTRSSAEAAPMLRRCAYQLACSTPDPCSWTAIGAMLLPNVGGWVGSIFTLKAVRYWYQNLNSPSWRPSNFVLGPVWTGLYCSMGFASYLVWREGGGFSGCFVIGRARLPLALYGIQLALNWSWAPIFYGAKSIMGGLINILILDAAVVVTAITFFKINKISGYLFIPYIGWLGLATALNYVIYRHNPQVEDSPDDY